MARMFIKDAGGAVFRVEARPVVLADSVVAWSILLNPTQSLALPWARCLVELVWRAKWRRVVTCCDPMQLRQPMPNSLLRPRRRKVSLTLRTDPEGYSRGLGGV